MMIETIFDLQHLKLQRKKEEDIFNIKKKTPRFL